MKSIVACLLVLVVSVHSQWPNNFAGYGLNPAGFFGGFNGLYPGYAGLPAGPFYGHSGRFVNYPAASLPAYDAFGNQVGGYGQVQDTPEVTQAKAAHFAAHAAARARLFTPVVAAPVAAVPVADAAVTPTLAIETTGSSLVETVATPVVETVSAPVVEAYVAPPFESVAVASPIMSRKKRQIQLAPQHVNSSPFAYNYASPFAYYNHYAGSPFAYSNFGTPFGYNYGSPYFGYHFGNPFTYNGQYYPTAYNNFAAAAAAVETPVVVASPAAVAETNANSVVATSDATATVAITA
ncbi:hypothetical protein DAPPUDRAFT_305067 [Daphnia pulex]|uniref:Uncharacterized protein n=1 Tax=Daphnia pulex TaxID=6669 RepID=E9HV85_DAPPU|nr:hypothetical protein DAPPUDRAFT_305067 [Daphnia pulex]|eukprot:EFX64347.1 hypothetical protein DAPPUDRAFT_305067 [Daphnia pulex]